ncbi:DUF1428 domain-containing protein [Sphingomonas sp.]|uniref:DUF1428 domain-containing protein n=1 Tax=Sphingomonas sp. TaxID=28214 RepID=UPI001B17CA73|nr:DUF1428 domain-containing protein [Sphingomonas sp.]MBO9712558.1 DUF1428 domain-containing protein [Sphingomonas sp.]
MYIATLVIPVPEAKLDAYRQWAERSAAVFRAHGCLEVVDGWQDNVPRGRNTDFFRAVDAREGEKIAVSWQVWPDKASLDAAEEVMHVDGSLDFEGEIPFDPTRLIVGCFETIQVSGR